MIVRKYMAIILIACIAASFYSPPKSMAATTGSQIVDLTGSSSSLSKIITVPNLVGVTSVTSNKGSVSYTRSGNNITVNATGANYTSFHTPSDVCSTSMGPQSTDSFPPSKSCTASGISGNVNKSGGSTNNPTTSYQSFTGSVGPQSSNSFSSTYSINQNGYSGSISKNGSPTSSTSNLSNWVSGKGFCDGPNQSTYARKDPDTGYSFPDPGVFCSSSIIWSENGYTGTLGKIATSSSSASGWFSSVYGKYTHKQEYYRSWNATYSGNLYKSDTTYTQAYAGTLSKTVNSYTQTYSGTVSGSTIYSYDYAITVTYTYNQLPSIMLTDTAPAIIYRNDSFTINANAADLDGTISSIAWSGALTGIGASKVFNKSVMGNYTVTATATDNNSGTATASKVYSVVNRVPFATITAPSGTSIIPTRVPTAATTITWNYYDGDGDPQNSYRVLVRQASNNSIIKDSNNVASSNTSWSTSGLNYNTLYYVTVSVFDGTSWGSSTQPYMRTNAQSTPNLTKPSGTSAEAFSREARTFNAAWTYLDPEGDPQTSYRLRILNNSTSAVFSDSGVVNSAALLRNVAGLTKNTLYKAELTTYDGYDWGVMSTKYFFTNLVPTSNITFPTGTSIATATGSPVPFAITWDHNDLDGDIQTQYDLQVYRASNNTLVINSGVVTNSTHAFNVTSSHGLTIGETYYVRVRTSDGESWSSWSPNRYFITNRPPVSDFTWTPSVVHEGDTRTFTNVSTDPDPADVATLTSKWQVDYHANEAVSCPQPTTANANFTSKNLTLPNLAAGAYCISLQSTDQWGAYHTITKKIGVSALSVDGNIAHTPVWDAIRLDWNSNHSPSNRPSSMFWAGERFILSADTTATGTSTKASSVVATLSNSDHTVLDSVNLTVNNSPVNTAWTGESWATNFEGLSDGIYTFTFTATYNNGTVKTNTSTFTISEKVGDVVNTQLR